MSTLATLLVGLGIDTRQFEQGIDRAEQKSREMSSGLQSAGSSALGFIGAMAGMAVASGLFNQAKDSIIGMNATLESSTLQFTTLTHDADFAAQHIKDLFKLGAETPFESQSLINASATMEVFGKRALDTEGNLRLFGDAAAATTQAGVDMGFQLQQVTFWSSRMYAALQAGKPIGEMTMRLQELGILGPDVVNKIDAMKKAGVDGNKIWAVYADSLGKFSGAMALQSQTWQGLSSSISDNAKMLVATAFRPLFDEGKKALTGLLGFLSRLSEGGAAERFADRLRFVIAVVGEFGARMLAYARMAVGWGANIGNQLASGLSSAIAGIVSVLRSIGNIIASWLRPGSPPKITPGLDKWGQEAGQLYLDSWSNIDYDSLSSIGNTIQDTLQSLADIGGFPANGVIPAVLAGREGFAKILNDLPLIGDVAGSTFDDIVRAMGPAGQQVGGLIRAYANLVRSTREVETAQAELNATTARYDAMLKPLNAEMQALQDREAEIRQNQQLERDYKTLADTSADASDRQLAQNDIEQIMLARKIKGIDKERQSAVDAAQEKLDAAKAQQEQAQAQVQQQQKMIDATNQQNKLVKQQIDLMRQMVQAQKGNKGDEQAKAAADAQWRYNFAMADGAGKLKMLQDKLATLNPSQAEYWDLLGQINGQQMDNARQADEQIQKNKDLAQAQWDHNFAVADNVTKMQMLKDKLASLNPAQTEYWQTLTDIDQLQDQMNAKAAAGGKGAGGGLGAIGASATDALGPINTFSQAAADMQAKIDAIDIKANNFAEDIQTKFETAIGRISTGLGTIGTRLQETFGPAIDSTITRINLMRDIVVDVFNTIVNTSGWYSEQITTSASSAWNRVVTLINTAISSVNNIVNHGLSLLLYFWDKNGVDITASVIEMWLKVSHIFDTAAQILTKIITFLTGAILTYWENHGNDIVATLTSLWLIIKNLFLGALTIISGVLDAALKLMNGDWQGALKTLEDTGKAVWENIKAIIKSALDLLLQYLGFNLTQMQMQWNKIWGDVWLFIKKIWEDIPKHIEDGVAIAIESLSGFSAPFDDIKQAIKDTIEWVQRFIDKLSHIEIPDILKQSSPSAFEQSLLDVGNAFMGATDASSAFNSEAGNIRAPALIGAANSGITTGGGSTAGKQFVINIDARGSNWTEQQFKDKVLKTLDEVVNGASNADRFAGLSA